MSIKNVEVEVGKFLESKEPEVLCVSGKWGVGKTFTWNKYLETKAKEGKVGLERYSYVSLFGINSLEELKASIFECGINITQLDEGPSIKTIQSTLATAEWGIRKITGILRYVPQTKDYVHPFVFVRNQIICLDDLERAGKGLTVNDVFGLVSFLKEQRKCKVILLLNDEMLVETNSTDFKNQLEKVVDVEMAFVPTAQEALDIAIDKTTTFHEKFASICASLGITNIRVIRKIQRIVIDFEKHLVGHDERILSAVLSTLVLLGWSKYEKNIAPSTEYLKTFNRYSGMFGEKDKETEQQKKWRTLISATDFAIFDELDHVLLNSIQYGYFDQELLNSKLSEADKKWKEQDKDNSFGGAWSKYHNSFESNEKEVLEEMFNSFKKSVQYITPSDADATIRLFRKFKRDKQADELVQFYIENRKEGRSFYDPQKSVFLDIQDSGLKKAFEDKLKSFVDNRNIKDVLIHIAGHNGWNPEDISLLAGKTSDEYYELFKSCTGDDLRIVVSQSLKFRQYNPTSDEMRTISDNAEQALKKIANESEINKMRVSSYGIDVGE